MSVRRLSQPGFTLVELMVSITISLLLLAGVVAIFVSSKKTYESVERLSRIQEDGRYALDAIVRDVRAAGYLGCSRQSSFANTLNSATAVAWNFQNAIQGFNFQSGTTWSPAQPAAFTNIATGGVNGSDALLLRVPALASTTAPLRLVSKMTAATGPLTIQAVASGDPAPVKVNQVLMVSDCQARAVFEVTGYNKTTGQIDHDVSGATTSSPGNATDDLQHQFDSNSQIVNVQTVGYYIGTSGGRTGLWRVLGTGTPEELVEGVERMELLFGVDTNADRIADTYSKASAVTNWDNVVNVSIALLVRSTEEYGSETDSKDYQLLDKPYTAPGDRHMRQVFETTATLRNRVL